MQIPDSVYVAEMVVAWTGPAGQPQQTTVWLAADQSSYLDLLTDAAITGIYGVTNPVLSVLSIRVKEQHWRDRTVPPRPTPSSRATSAASAAVTTDNPPSAIPTR
jgi:hypothetical protein